MLVKDFCKTLLGKTVDEAKLIIKPTGWKVKDLPYKENMFLPDIKQPKTIILLANKIGRIVDVFGYDPKILEM
jgi:hypothetical protein